MKRIDATGIVGAFAAGFWRSDPELPAELPAAAVLVLDAARLAVPELPPDPAEVLHLEDDHADDREEQKSGGHADQDRTARRKVQWVVGPIAGALETQPERGKAA
jgi:hypothetical protein